MKEKKLELNDFEIICRICLDKKQNMSSIFENARVPNLIITYKDMLEECASVHISNDDLLPKNVCCECTKYLEKCYKFKIQYLSTEKILEQIIANSDVISKVEQLKDETDDFKFEENSFETFTYFVLEENDIDENITENVAVVEEFISIKEESADDLNTELIENDSEDNCYIQKYKCDDCEMGFQLKKEFYKHRKFVHLKGYTCIYCNRICDLAGKLWAHSPEEVICEICKEDYGCKTNLKNHIEQVHSTCEICGKMFKNRRQCEIHLIIHGNRRYLCTHCGKAFSNATNFSVHVRRHTGVKPYQCNQCDAAFPDRQGLTRHYKKHSDERRFECDLCKSKFKSKDCLRKHKNSHVEEKMHSCDICNKKFTRNCSLRKHQKVHTGERDHVCTYCNKAFLHKKNLKMHLRIHTGVKPFVCSECGKAFCQKNALTSHMKTHSIKDPSISDT